LRQGVQGISDLITLHGIINVDFADVKAIMQDAGSALMGIGRGSGDNRAVEAARAAIESPLLDMSIDGAKGILFNITGGTDLGMYEIDEAAKTITEAADDDANIIFGSIIDEAMQGEVKITVIATGFETENRKPDLRGMSTIQQQQTRQMEQPQPEPRPAFGEVPTAKPEPSPFSSYSAEPRAEDEDTNNDDELDVPAFIRRKLK